MSQIIPHIKQNVHPSWQKELANVVTDPEILLKMLNIEVGHYLQHFKARKLFPVRVPVSFINRMEKNNINDPLLKQVMPLSDEFIISDGYLTDPLEEHDTVAEGLLHKYNNRVLMIVKAACAINCRYCFRRHFPYAENSPNKVRWQPALDYIAKHAEISEVIFSGGDPLMASDEHIAWLIKNIETISHVKRLRIHTRLPVVIPARITTNLIRSLTETRLKPTVVFHINHPNEINTEFMNAVTTLKKSQIPLFNQSVLLKNINNCANILAELSEKLFDSGIQPYYLHLFDAVQGAAHFDISEQEAVNIYTELQAKLSGFLVPKLVREIAGKANKTLINMA